MSIHIREPPRDRRPHTPSFNFGVCYGCLGIRPRALQAEGLDSESRKDGLRRTVPWTFNGEWRVCVPSAGSQEPKTMQAPAQGRSFKQRGNATSHLDSPISVDWKVLLFEDLALSCILLLALSLFWRCKLFRTAPPPFLQAFGRSGMLDYVSF